MQCSESDDDSDPSSDPPSENDDYNARDDIMDLGLVYEKMKQMCQQYLEQVTDNHMTQGGAVAAVNIQRDFIQCIFRDDLVTDMFPKTYYMLQQLAKTDEQLDADMDAGDAVNVIAGFSQIFDICKEDDYVFPLAAVKRRLRDVRNEEKNNPNRPKQQCPLCANVRSCDRQLLYFCIVKRIQTMWAHERTRQLLL